MPVSLKHLRETLLPGLNTIRCDYVIASGWDADIFWVDEPAPVSIPVALAAGAAAMVISNPPVTRRGLLGWLIGHD